MRGSKKMSYNIFLSRTRLNYSYFLVRDKAEL